MTAFPYLLSFFFSWDITLIKVLNVDKICNIITIYIIVKLNQARTEETTYLMIVLSLNICCFAYNNYCKGQRFLSW